MAQLSRRVALLGLALGLWSPGAEARRKKPKFRWTTVVPERKDRPRVELMLKEVLEKESKKARWGREFWEEVDATLELKHYSSTVDGEIARVTCSAVGKIKGLGMATSRFSYGGSAAQRAQLEKHVLELVSRGIVVRLAEIARERYDGWHVTR